MTFVAIGALRVNAFPASHDFCCLLLSSAYVLRQPILQTILTKIRLLPREAV